MEYIRPTVVILGILVLFLGVRTAISLGWNHRKSKLLRTLGSLHLAVLLIASLAALLSITTFLESSHGTEYVLRNIYRSRWFEIVLIGVFVNIFAATILRFPFPWKKSGFVLTHIGILTILVGSLMTRISGMEGTITLPEGRSSSHLSLQGNALKVHSHNTGIPTTEVGVDEPGEVSLIKELSPDKKLNVEVVEYHPHGEIAHQYLANKESSQAANPAIHFEIRSSMFQLEKWLVMKNEDLRTPNSIHMGPASISLKQVGSQEELAAELAEPEKEPEEESKPILKISLDEGKSFQTFVVKDFLGKILPLGDPNKEIKLTGLFQNAAVADNFTIVENPNGGFNPAVTFEITDNTPHEGHNDPGHKHHPHSSVRFQLHPEYQGSHKGTFHEPMILLEGVAGGAEKMGSSLVFLADNEGKFHYRVRSSKGQSSGEVALNKVTKLNWSDAVLVVKEIIPNAEVIRNVIPKEMKPNQQTSLPFVKVRFSSPEKTTDPFTLLYGETRAMRFGGEDFGLSFGEKKIDLPFEVKLDDFRKIDYPNTSRAMSYESDVTVTNLDGVHDGISTLTTTISMNNVLDFRGWRFFQASFRIDGDVEYSTFQVARDPGIETIYLGSIIMVLGIALMFWWKPEKRG